MCIGCLCEGFMFADAFGIRINGPVDNMHGYNFKSTLDLFNGNLFNSVLNDKIDFKENQDPAWFDDDNYIRYYCGYENENKWVWRSIHTNFESNERKDSFKNRINNFNEYNKNLDEYSWYLYTISDHDQYLSEEDFNYTIKHLPSYVIDKLIVITGTRFKIPKCFNERFNCIQYNFDMGGENRDTIVFKNWQKIIH